MTDELTPMLKAGRSLAATLKAAHDRAVMACCDSAEELGLTMSCGDEGRCPDGGYGCAFFAEAMAIETKANRDAMLDAMDTPSIGHDQSQH